MTFVNLLWAFDIIVGGLLLFAIYNMWKGW